MANVPRQLSENKKKIKTRKQDWEEKNTQQSYAEENEIEAEKDPYHAAAAVPLRFAIWYITITADYCLFWNLSPRPLSRFPAYCPLFTAFSRLTLARKHILVAAWRVNKRIHQSTARRTHTKVTMWVVPLLPGPAPTLSLSHFSRRRGQP